MKPDGVTMDTTDATEPTEAAAAAEPSESQFSVTEQMPSQPEDVANNIAPEAANKADGKPDAANPKVKPQAVASKMQVTSKTAGASGSKTQPGAGSHRSMNDTQSSSNNAAKTTQAKKMTTAPAAKASTAGAASKRPVGVAAVSTTVKNQTRVLDKRPAGSARTASAAATAANGTKPKATAVNGIHNRRTAAETVGLARPKSTAAATSRLATSTAPKTSTSTTSKAEGGLVPKTTRAATGPNASRLASSTSRPSTAPTKPSNVANARTAASRVTTAPSSGRTTTAQPPRTAAAAKKDISRPLSAAVAKRPTTATTSAATSAIAKKPEPSKPATTGKLGSASKWSATAKPADPKVSQTKAQQPPKPSPIKKPSIAATRLNATNKPPLGRTPPASPASKPANGSTPQAKRVGKPTQAVPPFTSAKKTKVPSSTTSGVRQRAAGAVEAATATAAVVAAAAAAAAAATALTDLPDKTQVTLPQEPPVAASAPEEIPPQSLAENTPPEGTPQETDQGHSAASPLPQSPVRTPLPDTSSPEEQLESVALSTAPPVPVSAPAEPTLPPVATPSEEIVHLLTEHRPSTSKSLPTTANSFPQVDPPTNLNEEEDEEESKGSQLVSVSEMSGTTQPTEESRPGSAGPMGGSAWRAGGALLSELDSEEVSGSQQGASELSAPGVLEGTESMDDLGDGSLKGAMDMEGASAGSPDFEKLPDIPVNDFEEDDDDEDDNDRVCDMDVGSERTDEPQRPRHDNDVDDEEDEDVEMASEGVTESGLESYGNADEDDFAEDERLDNLNRMAQLPPPPQLPSAPAAQWDQPNPFADPWAEPLHQQQPLDHVSHPMQMMEAASASPLVDPWQVDPETPTQSPAQDWLELSSAPNPEVPPHSFGKDGAQIFMDQSMPAAMQMLTPAPLSAPGMSLSSTLSSESSTPEELGDYSREGKPQPQGAQALVPSPQPGLDNQDVGIHFERGDEEAEEDAEAETMPADDIQGGHATAPASNPSSSSVTEDEATDTEGEAQLEDSLESHAVADITYDAQPPSERCLSTVEEGEEADTAEAGATDAATPPSATSLASYGFDTTTTASSSNAQSTGESCIRSPGIFSLEELPEEAKEVCLIPGHHTPSCLAEQPYIECGKREAESAEPPKEEAPGSGGASPSATLGTSQQSEENPDDVQPPYYSAICEKTENSFAGFTALPHPHRRDHPAHTRTYCDIVKPHHGAPAVAAAPAPPRLTCADLPPRSGGQQALSPQLRRLEQHQRQLLEMQHRREQQSRPLEEAEQERKRREEEEQKRKKEEAEEEIKRNREEQRMREQAEMMMMKKKEEELKQRRELELQLQQQQDELKQRQQIMQWQQELQQSNKGQTVLLSPSSGLCTIYEALESSDGEVEGEEEDLKELSPSRKKEPMSDGGEEVPSDVDKRQGSSPCRATPPPRPDSPQTPSPLPQNGDGSPPRPTGSPERPPPLDLDWGKKVDIVQQLINQTLLLNGDGCSSLLLLPGGAGGTLSPLESSLWPSLLPPLTPPSATVTSVSSFSPEATGSSPQGEWTVVELETHH